MSNDRPQWHVSEPGGQPAGPFTAQQVLAALQAGRLSALAVCWHEGMPQWLPLREVEPFASATRAGSPPPPPSPAGARSGGLLRRLAVAAVVLGVVGIAGYGGWIVMTEKSATDRGRRLLADRDHAEACRAVEGVAANGYVYRREANYLAAVAATRRFACEKDEQDRDDLQSLQRRFDEILADHARHERANTDLADLLKDVPVTAPDVLPRCLALADLLAELEIADRKQLARDLLNKARQVAERSEGIMPSADIVAWICSGDPSLAKNLLTALDVQGDSRSPFRPRDLAIHRWTREQKSLGGPLARGLLDCAEEASAAGRMEEFERCVLLAQHADPESGKEIAAKRLKVAKRQIEAGAFDAALKSLDRLAGRAAKPDSELAGLQFAVAEGLAGRDPASASRALDGALKADPALAGEEKASWLWIELHPHPKDERLRRCEEFLRTFPKSPRCPKALVVMLADGVQSAAQLHWQPEQARSQLQGAQAAASQLLAKHRDVAGLDKLVLALAGQLAATGQKDAAGQLAASLLEAVPQTALKDEIARSRALWQQEIDKGLRSTYGTLSKELVPLVRRVEKELKLLTIHTPATVRALANDPAVAHVAVVPDGCTANLFNKDEKALLRDWVEGGGILWVNNDVLSIFGVGFAGSWMRGRGVFQVALTPDLCPITAGCDQVEIAGTVQNLTADRVAPLLARNGEAGWSLVRYGKGWISNVPSVSQATYDGARFWLNFRLFCMGQPIPGARSQEIVFDRLPKPDRSGSPEPETQPPPPDPTIVLTAGDLEKALTTLDAQRVMWIQLLKADVPDEPLERIKAWVEKGGVLWLDTDLGRSFGFRLVKSPGGQIRGQAVVFEIRHPAVEALAPLTAVRFVLSPSALAISGDPQTVTREMTPLVGRQVATSPKSFRVWVALAARNQGRGVVVYRPREFDADAAGTRLERNLRAWSFKLAPPVEPKPAEKQPQKPSATGKEPGAASPQRK